MNMFDFIWSWLIQASVLCGIVLVVGALCALFVRQPADRLRLIFWILICCLMAPWVSGISSWKLVAVNLVGDAETTQTLRIEESVADILQQPVAVVDRKIDWSEAVESLVAKGPAISGEPSDADSGPPSAQAIAESEPVGPSTIDVRPTGAPTFAQPAHATFGVRGWIVAAYLDFAALVGLRWLVGGLQLRRLRRASQPASAELRQRFDTLTEGRGKNVALLVSDRIDGPITWGVIRPVILLPARIAQEANSQELQWCLAHEWSHVERRDVAMLLLANVVQAICFYQPLYWWLRRQLVLCQDFIADSRASHEADAMEDYADFLVNLAKLRLRTELSTRLTSSMSSLGIVDSKSSLFRRVKMLIESDAPLRARCRRIVSVTVAAGSVAVLALLGTIRLDAAGEAESAKQEATTPAQQVETKPETKPVDAIEPSVIQGLVVDATDGTPIADAQVVTGNSHRLVTTSKPDGSFRIENVLWRDWPYDIMAYRGNLVSAKTEVVHTAFKNSKPIFAPLRLELRPGKQARFRITSAVTGAGIEGASVELGYPDERKVASGADGIALVEGLLPREYYVKIHAAGHAAHQSTIELLQAETQAEFDVTLPAGGIVRGIVLDDDGTPASGIHVSFATVDRKYFSADPYETGADGQFRNLYVPLGSPIQVRLSEDEGFHLQQEEIILTPDAPEKELELKIKPRPRGKSIAGVVKDEAGNPVTGATITSRGVNLEKLVQATSGDDGRFVLHDISSWTETYVVHVTRAGFAPKKVQVEPGIPDNPGSVEIALEKGHSIRGKVVDEEGKAVSRVSITPRSPHYVEETGATARTGEQGEFELADLPAGAQFDFKHQGSNRNVSVPLELDGDEPVVVKLEPFAVLRGQVVDAATNQPIPRFRLRLGISRVVETGDPQPAYDTRWTDGVTFGSQNGEFLAQPFTPGMAFQVTVDAPGYEQLVVPRAVAKSVAEAADLKLSLKLFDPAQRATLRGTIVDHEGHPAAGAQLRLIVTSAPTSNLQDSRFAMSRIMSGELEKDSYCHQLLLAFADDDGRFEFKNILPNRHLQLVYWGKTIPQGRSLAFEETRAGEVETVTVKAPQPGTIRVTLTPELLALSRSVSITSGLHQTARGPSDSEIDRRERLGENQRTVEFKDLPPGEYSLSIVSKPEEFTEKGHNYSRFWTLAHRTVQLEEGATSEVEFSMQDVRERPKLPNP